MTFHQETDKKVEFFNHTVVHFLQGYHGENHKWLDGKLPYLHLSYDRDIHSSRHGLWEIRIFQQTK